MIKNITLSTLIAFQANGLSVGQRASEDATDIALAQDQQEHYQELLA